MILRITQYGEPILRQRGARIAALTPEIEALIVNVAAIAERFGGGGHKQAAGAILPGPVPTAIAQVLTAIKAALAT